MPVPICGLPHGIRTCDGPDPHAMVATCVATVWCRRPGESLWPELRWSLLSGLCVENDLAWLANRSQMGQICAVGCDRPSDTLFVHVRISSDMTERFSVPSLGYGIESCSCYLLPVST